MPFARTTFSLLVAVLAALPAVSATERSRIATPRELQVIVENYCGGCHAGDDAEGGIDLLELEQLPLLTQLELLNKVQDQMFFGLMPPDDADQPPAAERSALANWVRGELRRHNASKLDDKLRYPDYGNYVDHEQLFSGEIHTAAWSPARRWLVSPQIFHERVMDVFGLAPRERENYKSRPFYGVTNPFTLPDHSGVRYYDLEVLGGGHLLVMLDNAKWIASKQLRAARVKHGEFAVGEFPDARDRWAPAQTPAAFEAIVLQEGAPSDDEIVAAIQTQFACVLQRPANDEELAKYRTLTRDAIALSGNTLGLEQMLAAVLLESEFLYRIEFGEGAPDEHGRKKLSPREAAFAISYALGDRNPDPTLMQAAQDGRLATKSDYRREVERLIADEQYYRGQVDPTLNGKNYQSNVTSHPRLVRFFREFFGYPGALKVFKDPSRSGGVYANPDRGTQGTPGWLTLEADRIVTRHVEQDEHLFERLLTFDEFFVYHDKSNEVGRQVIAEWREVYDKFKDTAWKTEPQKVLEENLAFLQTCKSLRITDASRPGELVNYMHYFEESFGQGRTPFTTAPWSHGYYFHHAPLYNLPPTPSVGRYGSWKETKYERNLAPQEFWDYSTEQPFRIEHRKGILTHPAWLIAHSTNFHADAVRRGRWIREKLLAGRVPDVPITVDAQVPEDPHKTFRERLVGVTAKGECWKCHQHMNPLGLAFEIYDDFGRFHKEESLEHAENLLQRGNGKTTFDVYKTAPIVATGELSGTGDESLDGPVEDALDLIDRLAKSQRVRQSFIRHAFRFFMGRNEMLSDSQTLIDADRAYVESDGSFKAVVISLLSSDSFMYRK